MSVVDGREVHLDLRLVPAALTCWGVTAAGILWSISGVVVLLTVAIAAAVATAWWGRRRRPSEAGARMTAAGVVAIAVVGLGFAIAVQLRVDQVRNHPLIERYGTVAAVIVTPSETPRLARWRKADVSRVAAGRRQRRNVRPGSGFRLGGRIRRVDGGPARRIQGAHRQADPPRSHVAVLSATGEPTLG